jgi:hypothetical protein
MANVTSSRLRDRSAEPVITAADQSFAGDDPDDLLTVDALHQFAYCPRRAHLMHAEGLMAHNAFTEDGKRVHRRARFCGQPAAASLKLDDRLGGHRPRRCFRGQPAAASLKPGVRPGGISPIPRFPRPTGRGLIEATRSRSSRANRTGFPRPTGRGLIEAIRSQGQPSRPPTCFRGQPAAASLKHRIDRLAKRERLAFPRPTGRGLIEASCLGCDVGVVFERRSIEHTDEPWALNVTVFLDGGLAVREKFDLAAAFSSEHVTYEDRLRGLEIEPG